jgi:MYXO-CTERM domain-containing protein
MKTLVTIISLLALPQADAATLNGTPSNYTAQLGKLKAGDTLKLAAGAYKSGLNVSKLNGTAAKPIVISGPASGSPAVIEGRSCCNTVEITNSSHVVIKDLKLDGKNLAGVFGVSAKGGSANLTHHITIEGLTIVNHGASQQTVGISTKSQTWGWVIRRNTIIAAGTGLYLGNSNGADPFIAGLIEHNLVQNTVGYGMQIKHQYDRPSRPGLPTGAQKTIIRHNVFIKDDRKSPDGDRPNLLVDGFPSSGAGSSDLYEIYGNLLVHNPRESLLQASGRVAIHDNIFVDVTGTALRLGNHKQPLKLAHVYNNTIYAAAKGIYAANKPTSGHHVRGNLIFAAAPISGQITSTIGNLALKVSDAPTYVKAPSKALGSMDFYPLPGKATGAKLDLSPFAAQSGYDRDFNGLSKGARTYRGAYAGAGSNPGWKLQGAIKSLAAVPPPPADGGVPGQDGGAPGADSGAPGKEAGSPVEQGVGAEAGPGSEGGVAGDGGAASERGDDGCSCRVGAGPQGAAPVLLLLLLALCLGQRRRRA